MDNNHTPPAFSLSPHLLQYNCEESGSPGTGGEYATQTGYGLTNGVLIELLARYGQQNNDAYKDEEVPITSLAYLERAAADQQQNYCSSVASQEMSEEDCMRQLPQIQVLPMCSQPADDCDDPFTDPTSLCSICNPKTGVCPCEEVAQEAASDDDDCVCGPPPPAVQAPKLPTPKIKAPGGCPPCCPPPAKKPCGPPCPPAKAPCPPQPKPPACCPPPKKASPCPPQPNPPSCCPPPAKKACPPQPCPPACPPPAKPPCPPKAEVKEFCSICNCAIPQQVEKICSACNQSQEDEPEPCPPKPCQTVPAPLKDCDDEEDDEDTCGEEKKEDDCPAKDDCACPPPKPLPCPKVMPKGPAPAPWKSKLNSDECVCSASGSESESCSEEEEDVDECCCGEMEQPKSSACDDPPPCICDLGDIKCESDSDSDDKNRKSGNSGKEGCEKMDDICSVESQRMPQNKMFPLSDDEGKCTCKPEPPSPKRNSKGCN